MATWSLSFAPARPDIMSGQLRPPPPIVNRPKPADYGSSAARVQMRTLCAFLLRDLLNQSEEDINMAFENYGDNLRDLSINEEPELMRTKHGVSRINNIFDEYAGIAPDKRTFAAPEGIKVFKHIGFSKEKGGFAPLPTLTPKVKSPPPSSPTRTVSFLPDPNTNVPKGYTSPTSPGGHENTTWPKSQSFLDRAIDERRTNTSCKIPSQQQGTRYYRVGDGSVLNPSAQDRNVSKSYREVTKCQGTDPNRRLPNVALPGQSERPSSSGLQVNTGAPDIIRNTSRDITVGGRSAWIPRIEQASKSVTSFLRHGSPDWRFNIHSPDGYMKVSMLAQLPQFRQWKIDERILEVILMHGRSRLMLNTDKTKIRAIQGHTLEKFDLELLYDNIISIPFFTGHKLWGGNTPNMAVVEITNIMSQPLKAGRD